MRKLLIISAVILSTLFTAQAVTRDEMEQARAIAAKVYLRWANNGSDYLDKINPTSMADLESKLRDREKENIKAFKSIPVPSGYEQWDKVKLVEYWAKTALNASGLNEDGVRAGARSQIKSRLAQLSISAPAAEAPAAEAPAAVDSVPNLPDMEPQEAEIVSEQVSLEDSSSDMGDTIGEPARKSSSSSWIYVVALALLVIVVIVLVVYASRSMNKNNNAANDGRNDQRAPERARAAAPSPAPSPALSQSAPATRTRTMTQTVTTVTEPDDMQILREKYAETLAARQDEIRQLNRQVHELEETNQQLQKRAADLEAECERLRREDLMPGVRTAPVAGAATQAAGVPNGARQIFLGRVNANGIFVRADRNLNPGNSIYVLQTTDGFSGSFRVAPDQSVYDTAFMHPQEMLAGGCVAMDITNTRNKSIIVTESAGTAIFENNCWKVIRKAKIRYE